MGDLDRRLTELEQAAAQRAAGTDTPTLTDQERAAILADLVAAGRMVRTPTGEWQGTEARTSRIAELLNRANERRR